MCCVCVDDTYMYADSLDACHMRRRMHTHMLARVCMTCMSSEEEDPCMSYEEEDTCMSYEEEYLLLG